MGCLGVALVPEEQLSCLEAALFKFETSAFSLSVVEEDWTISPRPFFFSSEELFSSTIARFVTLVVVLDLIVAVVLILYQTRVVFV